MKKKVLKIIKISVKAVFYVLTGIVVFLTGICIPLYVTLKEYYKNSSHVFEIPDISKGFIPQGISYDHQTDCFFLTGYMDSFKPSPIYAVDAKSGKLKNKILMRTESGKIFRGHAGGISVYADELYVAGSTDACMYSYRISDVFKTPKGEFLNAVKRVDLKNDDDYIRVSFTSFDDSFVYAGEFRKDPFFYSFDSHWVETDKKRQKAYLFGFSLNETDEAVPSCVFSIPDNIQGACFDDEYIYLSQSHGLFSSEIYSYKLKDLSEGLTKKVLGMEIPLYILTENNAEKITKVPPMAEELVIVNGQLYILHESASNRYLIGKFLGQKMVRSTPVSYFRK